MVNEHTGDSWVYSDIVKDHFFNPKNLLLEEPDENAFDARGTVGSPACILPTTPVVHTHGCTAIQDYRVGDTVLTHTGNFQKVSRLYKPRTENSHLIKLSNRFGSLVATADHLIYGKLVPRGGKHPYRHNAFKKRQPTSWHHASEFSKGDIILYPIPKTKSVVRSIYIPRNKQKWDHTSTYLPHSIPVNERLGLFLGYYVAEGHSRTKGGEFGLTFAGHEMSYAQETADILQELLGISSRITVRPNRNRIDVCASNIHLNKLLKQWCGERASTKHVPYFLMDAANSVKHSFIKGLWRGDGFCNTAREHPRAGYATISYQLAAQLRILLLQQRIAPSMYTEKAKNISGTNHQKAYRLHVGERESLDGLCGILERPTPSRKKRIKQDIWFDDEYCYVPITAVESVAHNQGRLANFEIEEDHTYATDAFLVHNCGDVMDVWINVSEDERITELKWKTFGCGSAIAATSMFSVMITENGGRRIEDALNIKPQHIMERLGGLPNRKIHCSVLVDKAFRKAINQYFRNTGQHDRIKVVAAKIIDPALNITDKDIEEAVLEGAQTVEEVQKKLKVGVGSPESIPEIEQLIRFYSEKYYG